MRRHPNHWCTRCRGRIYSVLTAQRVDRQLLCVVCQLRALKENAKSGYQGPA